jgi:hypothetical protein
MFGNARSDSFRSSRYHCYFARQFACAHNSYWFLLLFLVYFQHRAITLVTCHAAARSFEFPEVTHRKTVATTICLRDLTTHGNGDSLFTNYALLDNAIELHMRPSGVTIYAP